MEYRENVAGWGWPDVRAALGGLLVRIAGPVLEDYHSDLYRDFQVVEALAEPEQEHTFVYVVRVHGTHIMSKDVATREEQTLVTLTEAQPSWRATWEVTVERGVNGWWHLSATRLRSATTGQMTIVRDLNGQGLGYDGEPIEALMLRTWDSGTTELVLRSHGRWAAGIEVAVEHEGV